MTIQQLLNMEVGEATSGSFVLQVIHTHRMTERDATPPQYVPPARTHWIHTVTLTDGTDEIKADVVLTKSRKFCRLEELRITACEIVAESSGGYGKKLLITEHERITYTPDQLDEPRVIEQQQVKNKWDIIGRGKVKHGQVCAAIQAGFIELDPTLIAPDEYNDMLTKNERVRQEIIKWTNFVMSPEDKYED